jgi:hypothetical protein
MSDPWLTPVKYPPELRTDLRRLARKEARINDHDYQPCPNNFSWEDADDDDWGWGMTWEDFVK